MVKGRPDAIVELIQERGHAGPPDPEGRGRVTDVTLGLAEVMVAPASRLDGATVRQARLREKFGVVVLGVLRHGAHLREHLGALSLRVGDTLLVQGTESNLHALGGAREDLIVLGGPLPRAPQRRKRILAAGVCAVDPGARGDGARRPARGRPARQRGDRGGRLPQQRSGVPRRQPEASW